MINISEEIIIDDPAQNQRRIEEGQWLSVI